MLCTSLGVISFIIKTRILPHIYTEAARSLASKVQTPKLGRMKYLAALVALATTLVGSANAVAVWGQCMVASSVTFLRALTNRHFRWRHWLGWQHCLRRRRDLHGAQSLLLPVSAHHCHPATSAVDFDHSRHHHNSRHLYHDLRCAGAFRYWPGCAHQGQGQSLLGNGCRPEQVQQCSGLSSYYRSVWPADA